METYPNINVQSSTSQFNSRVRRKLQKLHDSRIDASRISFPEKETKSEGGFSTVSRARLLPSNELGNGTDNEGNFPYHNVAVKKMKIHSCEHRNKVLRLALREAEILLQIDHLNIMKLLGFVEDILNDRVWLIFPWAENNDLQAFIASADWEVPHRLWLIYDLVQGVEHLHAQNPPICHGDLKSVNVVVNSEFRAIITDFGSAAAADFRNPTAFGDQFELSGTNGPKPTPDAAEAKLTNPISFTNGTYSLRWAAPEVLIDDDQTIKADVWSFGWVCYEIMTGEIPFEGIRNEYKITLNIADGKLPSLGNDARLSSSQKLVSLISSCWDINPKSRPCAKACQELLGDMVKDMNPRPLYAEPPQIHPQPIETINPPIEDEPLSTVQPGRVIAEEELPLPLEGTFAIEEKRKDSGSMADVYRALWTKSDGSTMEVAVKTLRQRPYVFEARYANRIKREMVIWMAAKHPNVLPFLGYTLNENNMACLVSPWCKNGNLTEYIMRYRPGEAYKLRLLIGAAHGVGHLHAHNPPISHGDIKPNNVIILDNLEAAVHDFGVSRGLGGLGTNILTTTGNRIGGSAAYQAKEILEGTSVSSPKGDVFSFGGLILATMSELEPFYKKKKEPTKIICIVRGLKPSPGDHPLLPANDPLWAIMHECWDADPDLRPSMGVLVEKLEAERTRRMGEGMHET